METIYKYELKRDLINDVMMPEGAQVLSAQIQYGEIVIWAKVNTDNPKVKRVFITEPTGAPFVEIDEYEQREYISTCQIPFRATIFVFHVFEIVKKNYV